MKKRLVAGLLSGLILTLGWGQSVWAAQQWETPSGLSASEFETYCDDYFNEKVKSEIPGVSLAVISNGEVIFEKGYGYSDIENGKKSDPVQTVYEYGSVSKLFTWTALMQLYEQGKVDLNTDISQYLPSDFQVPKQYDKPITILDLMNHQAGFDDYLLHMFNQKENMISLKDALMEHKVQQYKEPGFAMSYSNYGSALAGYIVENVTHMSEYQYVQDHIMRPVGMQQAILDPDIYAHDEIVKNKAKLYEATDNGFEEGNWSFISMYPAGGANGTVHELAQFAIALMDEENHPLFQNGETQKKMLSPSYEAINGVSGVAHGFMEYDGEKKCFWHNGQTEHSTTFFAVVPELDFGIVLCSNTTNYEPIEEFGFEMLQKREVILEKPEDNLPSTQDVTGYYLDFNEDHRGVTKLFYLSRYLVTPKVEAIGEGKIQFMGSTFLQIKPYLYQNIQTGEKMYFTMKNGKVEKASNIIDYIPVPMAKMILTWTELGLVGLFLISFLLLLIAKIKTLLNKNEKKEKKAVNTICSFISATGWIVITINYFTIINLISSWENLNTIKPYMLLGRGLELITALCSIGMMVSLIKKGERGFDFVVNFVYQILLLILIMIATSWGVFALI